MAKRKAAKRELINTGTDKRFARRGAQGRFKESDDVGRSLAWIRSEQRRTRRNAATAIAATGKVFVFFSNRLGCAGVAARIGGPVRCSATRF